MPRRPRNYMRHQPESIKTAVCLMLLRNRTYAEIVAAVKGMAGAVEPLPSPASIASYRHDPDYVAFEAEHRPGRDAALAENARAVVISDAITTPDLNAASRASIIETLLTARKQLAAAAADGDMPLVAELGRLINSLTATTLNLEKAEWLRAERERLAVAKAKADAAAEQVGAQAGITPELIRKFKACYGIVEPEVKSA